MSNKQCMYSSTSYIQVISVVLITSDSSVFAYYLFTIHIYCCIWLWFTCTRTAIHKYRYKNCRMKHTLLLPLYLEHTSHIYDMYVIHMYNKITYLHLVSSGNGNPCILPLTSGHVDGWLLDIASSPRIPQILCVPTARDGGETLQQGRCAVARGRCCVCVCWAGVLNRGSVNGTQTHQPPP